MFATYPSNVPLGTGHNYILCFDGPIRLTARAYLRCEKYTADTWRFFFSNGVDTTFANGETAWRDRAGGTWKILSAGIGDGGMAEQGPMESPAPVKNRTDVTFEGAKFRSAAQGERFWSDEVYFSLPEGHYLVWEWEIEGNEIPCTPDSQAATFVSLNGAPLRTGGTENIAAAPLPDLFGAKRNVKGRIAFLGDSITQGCGTRNNRYEMWAGRIGLALGQEYGVWNLGLGFARASDGADGHFWLDKAAQNDVVCITLGTNDILSGRYGAMSST